jgi:hypothetical protein
MPAAILLVWTFQRSRVFALGGWCLIGVLIIGQTTTTQVHRYLMVHLPGGNSLFQEEEAEEVSWLVEHTRPGDSFFEVANTRFYAPLKLRNPTPVDVLEPTDMTLPQWVDEAVEGLEANRTMYILWGPGTGIGAVIGGEHLTRDHLEPLRWYLQKHFVRIVVFGNGDEIWKRTRTPMSELGCR